MQNEVSEHLAKALRQVKVSLSSAEDSFEQTGLQLEDQIQDLGQASEIDPKSTMAEHLAKVLRQAGNSTASTENRLEPTGLQLEDQIQDLGQASEIDPRPTMADQLAKAFRQVGSSLASKENRPEPTNTASLRLKNLIQDLDQSTHHSPEIGLKSTTAEDFESVKTPSSTVPPLSEIPHPASQKATSKSEWSNEFTPSDKQEAEGISDSDMLVSIRDQLVECFDIGFNLLARIEEAKNGMDASVGLETWHMAKYLVDRIIQVAEPQPQVLMDVAINQEREPRYLSKFIHTCLLAINTGIGLGYSRARLSDLGISALLHDIGLFELPKAILHGDQKLTNREFEMMRQHTIIAVQRLRQLLGDRVNNDILAGIYQHHEQIDGQGYPEQKTEEGIHEFAQIIGIANAYEAITHKKQKTPHEAMREIIRLGGKSYSRKITRTFVNQAAIFPVGSLVTLTNGEIAKVISSNKDYPLRPVVLTLIDRSRHKVQTSNVLDLRETMTLNVNSSKSIKPEDIGIDRKDILYATGSLDNHYNEPVYIPDDLGTRVSQNAEGSENREESESLRKGDRSDMSQPDQTPSEKIKTADVNTAEVDSQGPIVSSQEDVGFSYSKEQNLEASTDAVEAAYTGKPNRTASGVYSDLPEISEADEEDALYQLAEQQLRSMMFSWPQGKPIPAIYLRAQVKKLKAAKRN